MKFPVVMSEGYQGATLLLDAEREMVSVLAADGTVLGALAWTEVIELAIRKDHAPVRLDSRNRMVQLALKVRYRAAGAIAGEGLTAEFGGGGFFLETSTPLPVGTELSVEFSLPDHPQHRIESKGQVIRIRRKPERQLFLPGMEVQFLDLAETDQQHVSALISALERTRSLRR